MTYDVIVLGVGGMGSAACYHLARRGVRVLGLEQFSIGHDRGSSHGQTRMIRQAIFEGPWYVPLARRAYHLWDRLAEEAGVELFQRNGVVIFGPVAGGEVLPGVLDAARSFAIPVDVLAPEEAARAFPGIVPPEGYRGVLEPGAGFLAVEACVNAHATLARRAGAILLEGVEVLGWSADEAGVTVRGAGESWRAEKLVITAGAWSAALLNGLSVPLKVHRQAVHWFPAEDVAQAGGFMPCFAFDLPAGFVYGVPALDARGVKIAHHWPGELVSDPSTVDRAFRPEDLTVVLQCVSEHLPGVRGTPTRHGVCMYTMSPDGHFVIDRHPRHPRVAFAAGFSGHGFKYAPVIGEILADLSLDGATEHDIEALRLRW